MADRLEGMPSTTQIVDPATGHLNMEWLDWFEELGFGTSAQQVGTVVSGLTDAQGNVSIDGQLVQDDTLDRSAMPTSERDSLGAEGVAANFYRQGTDPGGVADGSWWADTSSDELKIRIANAWQTIANISSGNLTATVSPAVATDINGTKTSVTVTPSGGATPYSYSYEATFFTADSPTAATTTFTYTGAALGADDAYTGVCVCTITDNNSDTTTITFAVTKQNISGT